MSTAITIFGFLGILAMTALCFYLLWDQSQLKKTLSRMSRKVQEAELKFPQAQQEAEAKYRNRYLKDLASFQERLERDNVHLLSQAFAGQAADNLIRYMKETIEKHCKRATQEFLGNVSDEAEGLTRDLQFGLCDQIWDSFQQYKEKLPDSPHIIPRNARLIYTKGHRTVVVVEQEPRVRTVGFTPSLVTQKDRPAAVTTTEHGYWYSLAFPYVYMVVAFDKGKVVHVEPYFANKRITSVKDLLHLAPMPNVKESDSRSTRHICLGTGGLDSVVRYSTMSEQIDELVKLFWSRVYNNHYGKGSYKKLDPRLKTLTAWQTASAEDPLFILTIQWKNGRTVKGIVEELLDHRNPQDEMDGAEKAVRELLDGGVKKLTSRIKDEIQQVKDSQSPKNLDQQARQSLEEVLTGHTKKVFELCKKG